MKTVEYDYENPCPSNKWTHQIISNDWILSYNDFKFELTEMPKKGQKKVRVYNLVTFGYNASDDLLVSNIIRTMELSDEESYEDVKNKMLIYFDQLGLLKVYL